MAGPAAQLDEAKRFAEIVAILQKHHLVQGLTPEKVRDIFVDLGPTFVKFGQILSMRSDILPKEYCAALETLRTDVTPMPLTEVEDILTQAYARPWQEVFSDIGIRPLGSASIAQVHAATLTDGQRVVVKVQRPDLYDIMSRDVRLLKNQIDKLNSLPENCRFVNYLRCHDDIGWGLDEDVERYLDIDPLKHKEFLYHFYEGATPGSWSMGELYNYDEATRDARSCGTTASLCGIEKAIITHDKPLLETSVDLDLMMHHAMSFLRGFPMLNCGDEIAQLNGWDYKEDPDRVEDSRNLHRSKFDWTKAALRKKSGTLQNQLWKGMEDLRAMRNDPCFAPDAWVSTWDTFNDSVLAVIRQHEGKTLVGLFNFSPDPQHAHLNACNGILNAMDADLQPYESQLIHL